MHDTPLTPDQLHQLRERRNTYPQNGLIRKLLLAYDELDRIAESIHAWENDTVADGLERLGYEPLP